MYMKWWLLVTGLKNERRRKKVKRKGEEEAFT